MTASHSTSKDDPIEISAGRKASGRLRVPSSKSLTHRWLNLALLSRKPMVVERPLFAEDTRLFLAALGRCGFQVEERGDDVRLEPGDRPDGEVEVFCGNAGTMLRFLVATLGVVPGRWRLDGVPRLRERPVGPLVESLRRLGARIEYLAAEGYVPLRIEGGSLGAGTTYLDAGESSQYLSAILMAALRAPGEVTVEVSALTSGPYVDVTLGVAEAAGGRIERLGPKTWRVHPSDLRIDRARVEGDWSAACYPASAAALTGGRVHLDGLASDSRQGDRGFLDLLLEMGAEADWREDGLEVRGTGRLKGVEADLSTMPDQVPTLAALGPFAAGQTRIFNVAHLRIKESDRLEAMATELRKLGAEVEEGPDSLRIPGIWSDSNPPAGPISIDPRGDHRIAMSLALAGLRRPGVVIGSPEVVSKSYPGFWKDLQRLLGSG
ncbi:MAG TPA: 3-phosphoshikimate 1-carboxyvinyltransferase [Thermoanaerobaculia bacterium]|nr:3-phosphoshikimate 1-carboxyvinyltransferase [Thermoanaerobaculia bacterium]